jgi:hypothetical protein
MLCQGLLHRFKLSVKPDLSDASLHVINTFQRTTHNFDYTSFESYRICEDTLVSFWEYVLPGTYQCGLYTGLTSARFADVISLQPGCCYVTLGIISAFSRAQHPVDL